TIRTELGKIDGVVVDSIVTNLEAGYISLEPTDSDLLATSAQVRNTVVEKLLAAGLKTGETKYIK
ncbi:MAG: hypothetical protein KDB22_03520, partial [Planctomycetales bacterium]|nr:hypothetical protein [Planctomycetales bacterium]